LEQLEHIFHWVAKIIDIIGIFILIYGFCKLLIKYLYLELKNIRYTAISKIQSIRCELGIYILLALDFLIASDIIQTITNLSWEQLIELSVMIILRIAIGYFLGKEIDEIHNKQQD
jgi:uncharacterized membrane protein